MKQKINWPLGLAVKVLDSILTISDLLDKDRLYLTGISMGGFGTWDLLQRYPHRFAAAIPICGGGDPAYANVLKSTPIWAFHGKKDKLVKVSRTSDMVQAVQEAGGNIHATLHENLGHLCWTQSYQNLDAIRWLLEQQRHD